MGDSRVRVLVVGTGPAGLAAAARVLEKGGAKRFRVRLATLGHHVGGKASSWRDTEGRLIDHGQHVMMGWYFEMKALLRRAGVDIEARLVSNKGHTHIYEKRDGKVHDLALKRNPFNALLHAAGYSGLNAREVRNATAFVLRNLGAFLGSQGIERFDDVCFTTWCLKNGLAPSIVRTNAFQASRVAQMNWPGEISAYLMLKHLRVIARDYRTTEYLFGDGGLSERFWEPLLGYIGSMGVELEMMKKLTAIRHAGDRVTGVVFAEPDSGGHDKPERDTGRSIFEEVIPTKPETEALDTDFDYVISTLPVSSFQQLNPGDATFWGKPGLAPIRKLRSIAPLGMQVWHRERLTQRYPGVVAGLEGPLSIVLDNKHIVREYRHNPRYGSVLYFVGQETGYEDHSDEELLMLSLENVSRLPGFERIDRDGILQTQVVRSRGPDKRYLLTEPGTLRFRPFTKTPFANLMLAGDWVRGTIDFPCMETAVRSGLAAADAVVKST